MPYGIDENVRWLKHSIFPRTTRVLLQFHVSAGLRHVYDMANKELSSRTKWKILYPNKIDIACKIVQQFVILFHAIILCSVFAHLVACTRLFHHGKLSVISNVTIRDFSLNNSIRLCRFTLCTRRHEPRTLESSSINQTTIFQIDYSTARSSRVSFSPWNKILIQSTRIVVIKYQIECNGQVARRVTRPTNRPRHESRKIECTNHNCPILRTMCHPQYHFNELYHVSYVAHKRLG